MYGEAPDRGRIQRNQVHRKEEEKKNPAAEKRESSEEGNDLDHSAKKDCIATPAERGREENHGDQEGPRPYFREGKKGNQRERGTGQKSLCYQKRLRKKRKRRAPEGRGVRQTKATRSSHNRVRPAPYHQKKKNASFHSERLGGKESSSRKALRAVQKQFSGKKIQTGSGKNLEQTTAPAGMGGKGSCQLRAGSRGPPT